MEDELSKGKKEATALPPGHFHVHSISAASQALEVTSSLVASSGEDGICSTKLKTLSTPIFKITLLIKETNLLLPEACSWHTLQFAGHTVLISD